MTRNECRIEVVDFFNSSVWGKSVVVQRMVCGHKETYSDLDIAIARGKVQSLIPPPCTCEPMVEPFEMI